MKGVVIFMAFMEWSDKYVLGLSEVDEQHKNLFMLVNKMHDLVVNGDDQSTVGKVLDELIDYTVEHFATEEKLFKQNEYPDYANHKREHDDLTQQVLDLQENFREKKVTLSFDLLDFLHNWLNEHTTNSDLEYATYAKSRT